MKLKPNHISLNISDNLKSIASPLQRLGVDFFSCTLYYFDGRSISLVTHPDWYKFFLNQEVPGCCNVYNLQPGQYLWQELFPEKAVVDASKNFNIDNGIQFTYVNEDHIEVYSFASKPSKKGALGLFIANADMLEKFIEYFRLSHEKLVKKATEECIILPKIMRGYDCLLPNFKLDFEERRAFFSEININEFSKLTKREIECLKYVARGNTAKKVGRILNISYRTVEKHIDSIKCKTNCESKTALIRKYFEFMGQCRNRKNETYLYRSCNEEF